MKFNSNQMKSFSMDDFEELLDECLDEECEFYHDEDCADDEGEKKEKHTKKKSKNKKHQAERESKESYKKIIARTNQSVEFSKNNRRNNQQKKQYRGKE